MNLAIVTGTTRGLGASLADAFEAVGWQIERLDRPGFDLERLNLSEIDDRFSRFDHVDRAVFINNAATHHIGEASSLQPEDVAREITINVASPIAVISAFLRRFPSGEIAHVTSAAATLAFPHWSLYSAGKAAMEGYLRSIEAEGVKVHLLNPGAVDTDMQKAIRETEFPGVDAFRTMKLKAPAIVAKALVWKIERATESDAP